MRYFRDFLGDDRGNVAMMFGLAVVGLIGISGLAVEYTRGSTMQTKLAAAADAAALAGAKTMGNESDRKKAAKDVFEAAVSNIPGLSNVVVNSGDVKDAALCSKSTKPLQ